MLPAHACLPDENGWFSLESGDRTTTMGVLMNSFPDNTHPHLQQVFYAVMQSAKTMAATHGNTKQAWDDWAEECFSQVIAAGDEHSNLEYEDEEELEEVAIGDGHEWENLDNEGDVDM